MECKWVQGAFLPILRTPSLGLDTIQALSVQGAPGLSRGIAQGGSNLSKGSRALPFTELALLGLGARAVPFGRAHQLLLSC